MIRLLLSLAVHELMAWNARQNAHAQRHAAIHAEEDANAYRAGIPRADATARLWESRTRMLRNELRARRLARFFR